METPQDSILPASGLTPPPPGDQSSPAALIVLEAYLAGWLPSLDQATAIVKSSQEIVDELRDMAAIEIDDVTAMMLLRGFRPSFHIPGAPGWLMQPSFRPEQ